MKSELGILCKSRIRRTCTLQDPDPVVNPVNPVNEVISPPLQFAQICLDHWAIYKGKTQVGVLINLHDSEWQISSMYDFLGFPGAEIRQAMAFTENLRRSV